MKKTSYICQGKIWKIEVFDEHSILVEIRDAINFKTEWKIFSILEEHCHHTIQIDENSWWFSLAGTYNKLIFIHELRQGKNPEIKGLKVINGFNKETIEYPNTQLNNIHRENNTYSIIDEQGKEQKSVFDSVFTPPNVKYPTIYEEENSFFFTFISVICNHTVHSPSLQCEYLEINNHVVIGYYVKTDENKYNYHLLILDDKGQKINSSLAQQEMLGKTDGNIFVLDNKIIYTKNNNEIEIITI